MAYGRCKMDNNYSRALFDIDAPKTVWMAIAFAFADRLTGLNMNDEAIRALISKEWLTLHQNVIVPQRPRYRRSASGGRIRLLLQGPVY